MNHRNYDKENALEGQTNFHSNRLESKCTVDIDISSLKIVHSKNANNREDRSISQPNSRNYQLNNLEEGKVRSKNKSRSNSARRLRNRQQQQQAPVQPQQPKPHLPQPQPQQQPSKNLIDESNFSNTRRDFSSSNQNQNLSSHISSRQREIHSNGTNENSNFNFQRSDRNYHRPSVYPQDGHHHNHHPHARGGHSAPPPPYSFNPAHHNSAGVPYFNPHMQQQMNSGAGFGSGFNNSNNGSMYPVVEILLTARDHEIYCAEQQESCPSIPLPPPPSSSAFRSAPSSPSQSEQPSHVLETEQDLQQLLEQTWAETDEMLCDQRDNIMQFYEAMKQAQIARCCVATICIVFTCMP